MNRHEVMVRGEDDPVFLKYDKGKVLFTQFENGKVSQFMEVPTQALWDYLNMLIVVDAWTPHGHKENE